MDATDHRVRLRQSARGLAVCLDCVAGEASSVRYLGDGQEYLHWPDAMYPKGCTRSGVPATMQRWLLCMVMAARRSPWLNDRSALLIAELGKRDITLPEDAARQAVSDHLDHVALMMGVGRRAARMYVTDDTIAQLARRLCEGVTFTDTGMPMILVQDGDDRP